MILVTGAAGYIGSHVLLSLIQQGHPVVALDNLAQSSGHNLKAVQTLTRETFPFVQGDIRDSNVLNELFHRYPIDAVIHLAGLKVISDSFRDPLAYYDNNVTGTQTLLKVMAQHGVCRMIFSSSAAVYGPAEQIPVTELHPANRATNPYGKSKQIVEQILQDLAESSPEWAIISLRYFNPMGADASGLLGEEPGAASANLMSRLCAVASGAEAALPIFGCQLPTPDGTGVRDFIHVKDLAEGHLSAIRRLNTCRGFSAINLGTGQGYSVLQVVEVFQQVTGIQIPCIFSEPRPGDVAECWADASQADVLLGWKARFELEEMLRDSWHRNCFLARNAKIPDF